MSREEFINFIVSAILFLIFIAIAVPCVLWFMEKEANIQAKAYKEVIFDTIDKLDKEQK